MSQFFPNYELMQLSSGIELKVFNCQDTIFQFASVETQRPIGTPST